MPHASLRYMTRGAAPLVRRGAVLARWSGSPAETPTSPRSKTALGKGMDFASGFLRGISASTRRASANIAAESTVADVGWDLCERMDYYVQYNVPSTWRVTEQVRENSIAIQCSPQVVSEGSSGVSGVHGFSLNCFAYKQRVQQPDSTKLLHAFLRRFNASVSNSLQILSDATPMEALPLGKRPPPVEDSIVDAVSEQDDARICEMLARQLNSAVAEVTFTPGPGLPLAHGLCRAFFNSNGRFHYVVVVAVPEEEYRVSLDLIIHTLAAVVESRVEAAAKRT